MINSIDSAQLGIKMTKKAKPPEQIGCCCIKKETSKQDLNKTTETSWEIEGEDDKPNYNVQTPEERLRNSEHNEARILQEDLRKVWTQWLTQ